MEPIRWNASATYVTGAHNMKAGYIGAFYWVTSRPSTNNYNLAFRVNNGIPNQITQNLNPWVADTRVRMNALYIQDQWTKGRMTLQGAMRYDQSWSYYVEQQVGPTRFLPTAAVFPESKGVIGYHDINLGLVSPTTYSGTGGLRSSSTRGAIWRRQSAAMAITLLSCRPRASRRARLGRGPIPMGISTRTAICPAASHRISGPAAATSAARGPIRTLESPSRPCRMTSRSCKAGHNRPSDWIIGATVQHELLPRVSITAGYTRRWLQNFTVTDNLLVSPADYTPFSVTAPLDPRLPGGVRLCRRRSVRHLAIEVQFRGQLPHVFAEYLSGL